MTKRNPHSSAADGSVSSEARTIEPEGAGPWWDRLIRARTEPPIVVAALRVYLPLARSLARTSARSVDPDRAEQAAELGLACAVLAWRQHDCTAFVAFARGVILHQLQAIPAGATPRRRLTAALSARHG